MEVSNWCPLLFLQQALQSLADYDEDSDEENATMEETPSPVKRQKMDNT